MGAMRWGGMNDMELENYSRTTTGESTGLLPKEETKSEGFQVDSAHINPLVFDPRYKLSMRTLGKLERLAKARFELREYAPELKLESIDPEDSETVRTIALSVRASSEIEGEIFSTQHIEAYVAALTNKQGRVSPELEERHQAYKDIVDTYFWVLNQKPQPLLTVDFIKDIHRRMFENSKPKIAGKFKQHAIKIEWQKSKHEIIDVPTVAKEKAPDFLKALCDRVNIFFRRAEKTAEASMFLITAEFALDFLAIHPFEDGNGRTARLLSSYLLENAGYHFSKVYPLDQIILDNRARYYMALNEGQRYWHTKDEDLSMWIEFFTDTVFEQWERAYRRIRNGNHKS